MEEKLKELEEEREELKGIVDSYRQITSEQMGEIKLLRSVIHRCFDFNGEFAGMNRLDQRTFSKLVKEIDQIFKKDKEGRSQDGNAGSKEGSGAGSA